MRLGHFFKFSGNMINIYCLKQDKNLHITLLEQILKTGEEFPTGGSKAGCKQSFKMQKVNRSKRQK